MNPTDPKTDAQEPIGPVDHIDDVTSDDVTADDPIQWFSAWLDEAREKVGANYNAMALATVDAAGQPSVRTVLLKEHSDAGFVFFTNHESRKGRELSGGRAGLCFYWRALNRQVRVTGPVGHLDGAASDRYFATRARESQLGAWASAQSTEIASRETLETAFNEMKAKFAGQDVPRPPHWGGFRIEPQEIEFWVGRENRLHDRWLFTPTESGWRRSRLAP